MWLEDLYILERGDCLSPRGEIPGRPKADQAQSRWLGKGGVDQIWKAAQPMPAPCTSWLSEPWAPGLTLEPEVPRLRLSCRLSGRELDGTFCARWLGFLSCGGLLGSVC